MRIIRFGFLFTLLVFYLSAAAQNRDRISGNFTDLRFSRLVGEIEKQTDWHIYYDSAETDSIVCNLAPDQWSLREVLDTVFRNTDFHYAIGRNNQVFVSRLYSIQTSLPANFFDPGKAGADSSVSSPFMGNDRSSPQVSRIISPENKLFTIGSRNGKSTQVKPVVAGYIRVINNGEPIVG